MKKNVNIRHILVIFAALTIAALSGCQQPADRQANEIEHSLMDRRIGQIESLGGIKTTSQGTHLLKLDDGSTILLKSLNINFDKPAYRGKIVEIQGFLTYTTDQKQIMDVQNLDVIEVAMTQQTATVNWREYANPILGFETRYRDDFQIKEDAQTVRFSRSVSQTIATPQNTQQETQQKESSTLQATAEHVILVQFSPHSLEKTLAQYLKLDSGSATDIYAAGFSKSKIGVNGLDAYKKIDAEKKEIHFYFDGNGRFYQLSFFGSDDSQNLEDQNVFYDFVSSFRLIGQEGGSQEKPYKKGKEAVKPAFLLKSSQTKLTPGSADRLSTQQKASTSQNTLVSPKTYAYSSEAAKTPPTSVKTTTSQVTLADDGMASSAKVSSSQTIAVNDASAISVAKKAQQNMTGYSQFISTTYKFSLQYPKSWYFGSSKSADSAVLRHYDFDTKPLADQPGAVAFEIVSGAVPTGSLLNIQGKNITKVASGDATSSAKIFLYYQGPKGRVYRISGPTTLENILINMIQSLEEN